jgi:hypothetical protein
MLRKRELEVEREKCRVQIAFAERRIGEQKAVAERQTETALKGNPTIRQMLNKTLADIEERKRELGAFRTREAALTAQIDALEHPSAKEAQDRAKHQAALAALAVERGAKDAAIDSVLQRLRQRLEERSALTAKMEELALLIDLSADLDVGRYATLEASLPVDVFAQSREWGSRFFGTEGDKEPYTVGRGGAVLPETLNDCGVYRPGENVLLSKERAKLLPPDEASKVTPGPVEMEILAGNNFNVTEHKPEEVDNFPVSGFRMSNSVL